MTTATNDKISDRVDLCNALRVHDLLVHGYPTCTKKICERLALCANDCEQAVRVGADNGLLFHVLPGIVGVVR